MKGITIKVDNETHLKLKVACASKGASITQVLTDLVNKWIEFVESEQDDE